MQNIFRGDGLLANPTFGEGDVLRNAGIEVMGDHHHIKGLFERIYGVRSRGSCGSRDDVLLAAYFDDVRGMPAPSALTMKCVNGSALESGDCTFDETTFIERIGVDEDLHIHVICD